MTSNTLKVRNHLVLHFLVITFVLLGLGFLGCSQSTIAPEDDIGISKTGVILGHVANNDLAFEFVSRTNGDPDNPIEGPFAIRGRNMSSDSSGNLVVDLSVVNLSDNSFSTPVAITFLSFIPSEVTVLNSDNAENGAGALINFTFEDGDGQWSPNEESDSRSTIFGVAQGTSFAFVVRIDVGDSEDGMGSIGGVVWNDDNGDGLMDEAEEFLGGVMIELSSGVSDPVTTLSAEDGSYSFDGLESALYTVKKLPEDAVTPTTPTEIQVLLIEIDGVVSSYLAANFGCQADDSAGSDLPIQVGDCVHVNGRYASDPHRVIAHAIGGTHHDDDDSEDGDDGGEVDHHDGVVKEYSNDFRSDDGDDDHDNSRCSYMEIRGLITDRDVGENIIEIMGTRVTVIDHNNVGEFEVGNRARVRVFPTFTSDDPDQRNGYRLRKWDGTPDKVRGIVEEVSEGEDGKFEIRVIGTLIEINNDTNFEN